MEPPTPQSPDLLTIKEVARRTGLPPSTIRYYDQQFEEFLGVRRGAGRRRLFEPQAVERLRTVQRLLKDQGLSLRQARRALAGDDPQTPAEAGGGQDLAALRQEVAALRSEMGALERRLRELKEIQQRTLALVDGLTRG